jgi:hypothetical protein
VKYIFILIIIFCSINSYAQDKTTEKRSTKDSTGRVVVTESEIISQTEDITPRRYMIVINPLKFFLFYNASFYFRTSSNIALGFGIQTPTIGGIDGFGANAEIRIHPSGKSLRGFYIAPNFSINSLTEGNSNTATITSIGVLLGWQWFPGDDFAMGLGIGLDNYWASSKNVSSFNVGKVPALRFDIGYAW